MPILAKYNQLSLFFNANGTLIMISLSAGFSLYFSTNILSTNPTNPVIYIKPNPGRINSAA
jgi:hypothetical protein